ncbi:MAG TPA: S53 family peptidase [Nevskiaceae bacterium]|nr:S53 family peptidase [Nevskiaceae bacterium]
MEKNKDVLARTRISLAVCALAAACASGAAQAAWLGTATGALPLDASVLRGELSSGESVRVAVSLAPRNAAELASFIGELNRAGSPAYGHFLTSQQYLERYAPTAAQVRAVVAHLQKSGFVNIDVAPNRLLVTADGTAGVVQRAFNTVLQRVDLGGMSAYANTRPAQVPQALAGIVTAVLGLQTVEKLHPMNIVAARVNPQATAAAHGFNPTAFAALYGASALPTASTTNVGIISDGVVTQTITDLRQFESQNSLPQVPVSVVQVGAAGTDTSGTVEWDLDSQDIQSMAGGTVQQLLFYDTTSLANADITAAFNKAVSDNTAKVVNVSLGECETSAQTDGMVAADDAIFEAGVAQGQIFSISTGDSGSHECSVLFATNNNTKQSYPAVSPYVMAIGGTSLLTTTAGAWASETVWSGAGGGPSTVENKPSWQTGVSGTKRGVPDVSFDADPNTGAIIIVNGSSEQVGGTSLAAPLFAGLWARIESANSNALGFPDASFYHYLPTQPTLHHDVTSGSNGSGGLLGGGSNYTAAAGWDFASGFGSLVGGNLATFVSQTPGF